MKFLSIFKESANSFDGEKDGEKVVLLLRRHPFVILTRLSFFLILAFAPAVAAGFFPSNAGLGAVNIFFFISSLWYLILWLWAFYALTMYTLDVWIVTNQRIIDSTQHGFFNRTVSELHLNRIQDISVQTQGIIQTFLKFGNLQIQTAGTEERFKFFQIPNPEKVKDEIMKLALPHAHI